ncbi:MAG: hypothetical protein AB1831_02135 [Pseudomonadota bacterium]
MGTLLEVLVAFIALAIPFLFAWILLSLMASDRESLPHKHLHWNPKK